MNKFLKLFLIMLIIAVLVVGIGTGTYYVYAPVEIATPVMVKIPEASTSSYIADELEKKGVIRNSYIFKLYLRITGDGGKLQAGSYAFYEPINIDQVIYMLVNGQVTGTMVTIPEGYNIKQIAAKLEEENICSKESFYKAMDEDYAYDYLPEVGTENRLEGYLFPETYRFTEKTSAIAVVGQMLKQFDTVLNADYRKRIEEMGMTINEAITLASLVEKEAKVEADRPIIAEVFLKRLEIDMPLQSCATIQYILGKVKSKLTYDDLKIQSPYNTYQNKGLPPGPIASPGKASIEAILHPAETEYLYFVAKPDGSHIFSKTLEEHNKAKSEVNQ